MSRVNEIKEYKSVVLKKCPLARLKAYNDTYYISDGNGGKVIPEDFYVSNSKTVFDAWKYAAISIEIEPTIARNTYKFDDSKIYESYAKKDKDKDRDTDTDDE